MNTGRARALCSCDARDAAVQPFPNAHPRRMREARGVYEGRAAVGDLVNGSSGEICV